MNLVMTQLDISMLQVLIFMSPIQVTLVVSAALDFIEPIGKAWAWFLQ